ncbi:TIGR02677 family protein [Salimicrobium flavidum]|uniref:TIGR02677 family protein n=1 Tax=Salimicrobium flavidum TaxID=570947 RepID=A0A1N7J6I3_9BACI|nr:TIGR02677 family protein [Salimicrobium flavidum]SIS44940.1 TIGR02677 family protein [Salimicrobium flavidum]
MNFKKVTEASYLTADKASTYRAILRYFYMQHERMREFLYPDDILRHLKEQGEFTDYTSEQLQADLDQLVKWGNIIARQEAGKVRTVDEFKKKRFRYQSTPYTVEFERMLVEMEGLGETFGGSLEKTQFERLQQALEKVEEALGENVKEEECSQRLDDVMTYFRAITKNTADYLAYLNSERAEEKMQTEAFLAYKEQFTTYLRDFIVGMQQTSSIIQSLLKRMSVDDLTLFFQKAADHKTKAFRFEEQDTEAAKKENEEKWESLKVWFLGDALHQSEYELLEERTNESIRRITRVMQRLSERHQHFHSRKKDYLHLAKWFDSLENIGDAHHLSAVAFGVFHTKHLHTDHVPTDDIYTDVWEEEAMSHHTKPRIPGNTERTKAGAVTDFTKEKDQVRKEEEERRKREKEMIETYIHDNCIDTSEVREVEAYIRKLFLSWIGRAMSKKDRTIKTNMGERVKVEINRAKKTELWAEDGVMHMPTCTFHFIDRPVVRGEGGVPHGAESIQ